MDENNNEFILINNDEDEKLDSENTDTLRLNPKEYDNAPIEEPVYREPEEESISEEVLNQDFIVHKQENYPKDLNKPRKKKFKGSFLSYVAVAIICSLLGGFVSAAVAPRIFANNGTVPAQYSAQAISINTNDSINTVTAVAKKAMSSVVGITTVETRQNTWPFAQPQDVSGLGSGVIIQSDGYILTNSHVVADGNAKELKVLFENGEQVDGVVLWNDSMMDMAIVKVDVSNLPVADLGDSDKLEVGEIAIAIGNPLGLEFQRTVTSGIISGLNRSVSVETGTIENLIQTDASINPGNSGGPLLNGKGEVIGINTAKINSGEGLGFAIPINEVRPIVEQIIRTGKFEAVLMGIKGLGVEEYKSILSIDISAEKGVVILEVQPNLPADKAGLMNGDVVTAIDDTQVESMNQLKRALYRYEQGDDAELTVLRNGIETKLKIKFDAVR